MGIGEHKRLDSVRVGGRREGGRECREESGREGLREGWKIDDNDVDVCADAKVEVKAV